MPIIGLVQQHSWPAMLRELIRIMRSIIDKNIDPMGDTMRIFVLSKTRV